MTIYQPSVVLLLASGYDRDQTRSILYNGIKGYMTKRTRRKSKGRKRIHYTAEESRQGRMLKKMIGKSNWYKNRRSC